MNEHVPECCFASHVCDVNLCQRCHAFCICNQLRVCEERAREDERSNNFTPDDHSDAMTEAYQRGLDAAREAVAPMEAVVLRIAATLVRHPSEDERHDALQRHWCGELKAALFQYRAAIDALREEKK